MNKLLLNLERILGKREGGWGGYKYERKEKGAQKPTLPNATPPQLLPSYLMQLPHT